MVDFVKKNGKKDGMSNKICNEGGMLGEGCRIFQLPKIKGKNTFCPNFSSKLFIKQYFYGF